MFEGETTIEFSKEAAVLMMSQNMSDLFKMPLQVTRLDYGFSGLKVTFADKDFLEQEAAAKLTDEEALDRAMPDTDAPVEAAIRPQEGNVF